MRLSIDRVPVLSHDSDVTDKAGKSCLVADHTAESLARLDLGAGEGVPSLHELASWAAGRCGVMADMKCEEDQIERKVIEALSNLGTDRKVAPGASEESRARFRGIDPAFPLSLTINYDMMACWSEPGVERLIDGLDVDMVTWEWPLLNANRIRRMQNRGIRVYAWTVDDIDEMRRLAADGVDGIISNRPDLLAQL